MDNLKHLMAAYFHQDWSAEYDGSWPAAVEDFARRAPARVPELTHEISALLERQPAEREVADLLDAMGNYRSPGAGPTAHIDWLHDIRALLTSAGRHAEHPDR